MPIQYFVVDAFTDRPFGGNPAAVCLMTETRPETWLKSVASEFNLSETAFVWKRENDFELRWFTPAVEVDLCGHATLATAHVLWQAGWQDPKQTAVFQSRSGQLTAQKNGEKIFLDFPARPAATATAPPGLIDAMHVAPIFVGRNGDDFLIEVASENEVRDARIEFQKIVDIDARGIILTALSSTKQFDFVSRFFAPAVGVNEDPVTGSAHCALAPHWSARLGKTKLSAFQASPRGGALELEVVGDRIQIGGNAILISQGELLV